MIEYLSIKNFVIIESLKLDFGFGLNIFTGETGAGKSIIVDAIGLLCGDKTNSSVIGPFGKNTEIEGMININLITKQLKEELKNVLENLGIYLNEEIIIRREINQQNKTKCFINDKMVTLNTLKEVASLLLDIHGQNEHQKLLLPKNHLLALDEFCDNEDLIKEYRNVFSGYKKLKSELEELTQILSEKKQKIDLLKHQLNEIENAKLTLEDEKLEDEFQNIKNSQKVINLIEEIKYNISGEAGIRSKIAYLEKQLNNLNNFLCEDEEVISVEELYAACENIEQKLVMYKNKFSKYDLENIDSLVDRIDLIKKLKRKYGNTVEQILTFAKNVRTELEKIDYNEEKVNNLTLNIDKQLQNVIEISKKLSESRKKHCKNFESRVEEELKYLGLEKAKFKVKIESLSYEEQSLTYNGVENVEFYISTNPGSDLAPLKDVVSGGELSRIMLAIKTVLGKKDSTPIMIFDEIDAGLSGPMGSKVGQKLRQIALENKQLFCITHLPQLSVFANKHFLVKKVLLKSGTKVIVNVLDDNMRVQEIARMLSDGKITETSLTHAKMLIKETSCKDKVC